MGICGRFDCSIYLHKIFKDKEDEKMRTKQSIQQKTILISVGIIAVAIIISAMIISSGQKTTTTITPTPKEPILKVNIDCDLSMGPGGFCPNTANAKVKFTSENSDVNNINVENKWYSYDGRYLQTQSRSLGDVALGSTVFDNFQRGTSCEETGVIPPRTGFVYLLLVYKVTCDNCKIQFVDSYGNVLEREDKTKLEFSRSGEITTQCLL
jgi:hypothetical protein